MSKKADALKKPEDLGDLNTPETPTAQPEDLGDLNTPETPTAQPEDLGDLNTQATKTVDLGRLNLPKFKKFK